jgi:hypothetical protein
VILNAKAEILEPREEDEDEFTVVYTRLVKLFKSPVEITVVFPLARKLLREIPPEELEVYTSLADVSCYKGQDEVHGDWLVTGGELLRKATEQQYLHEAETKTELARQVKTLLRQDMADKAMQDYSREKDRLDVSLTIFRENVSTVKETAVQDGLRRWKEMELERLESLSHQKTRLLRANELYKSFKDPKKPSDVYNHLGLLIGGVAVAGIAFAIVRGYQSK